MWDTLCNRVLIRSITIIRSIRDSRTFNLFYHSTNSNVSKDSPKACNFLGETPRKGLCTDVPKPAIPKRGTSKPIVPKSDSPTPAIPRNVFSPFEWILAGVTFYAAQMPKTRMELFVDYHEERD